MVDVIIFIKVTEEFSSEEDQFKENTRVWYCLHVSLKIHQYHQFLQKEKKKSLVQKK